MLNQVRMSRQRLNTTVTPKMPRCVAYAFDKDALRVATLQDAKHASQQCTVPQLFADASRRHAMRSYENDATRTSVDVCVAAAPAPPMICAQMSPGASQVAAASPAPAARHARLRVQQRVAASTRRPAHARRRQPARDHCFAPRTYELLFTQVWVSFSLPSSFTSQSSTCSSSFSFLHVHSYRRAAATRRRCRDAAMQKTRQRNAIRLPPRVDRGAMSARSSPQPAAPPADPPR